jgi:hypothetical protein
MMGVHFFPKTRTPLRTLGPWRWVDSTVKVSFLSFVNCEGNPSLVLCLVVSCKDDVVVEGPCVYGECFLEPGLGKDDQIDVLLA